MAEEIVREFAGEDKILVVTQSGEIQLLSFDLSAFSGRPNH